ncbi:MAG: PilZ domain-containing protein [Betaproteobacteria bacterium]|nr:PilZ domain-containing protein [Betaproteobacteria bacterium]
METNRRRFSRIHFEALAELSVGELRVAVKVLDLSLRGALVQVAGTPLPALTPAAPCTLAIDLGEEISEDFPEGGILMDAVVAHVHENIIGLRCVEIDLDSITSLRRVVEFNLGDEAILSRELEYLSYGEHV